jgi:ABC-type hemin transport system ATPase subunit
MDSTDTTTTASGTEEVRDVGLHWLSGEVMEVRTDNGQERSDLVCLTGTCGDHAGEVGAKPLRRWQEWLAGEGRPRAT